MHIEYTLLYIIRSSAFVKFVTLFEVWKYSFNFIYQLLNGIALNPINSH